ncbi:MAG TPA: hypothetical protein VNW06_00600 [Cytophagaceae bacterium]|jgi:hypothetical protein|nr:hypothetical protein [Cytophagaceae bacterium]
MTKKEINLVINRGSSHTESILLGLPVPIGITKFQAFLALKPILKGKAYWHTLRRAYELSDNLYPYRFDVLNAFLSDEPYREYLMDKEERSFLKGLPERVTIYRGMTTKEKKSGYFGSSWTLSKEKAEFFAHTYGRNMATHHLKKTIHKLEINKSEILSYMISRGEEEVIYIHNKSASVQKSGSNSKT